MFLVLLLAAGLSGSGGSDDGYDDDYSSLDGTSGWDDKGKSGKHGAPCPDEKCPKEDL